MSAPSAVAVLRAVRKLGLPDARDSDHAWSAGCPICRIYESGRSPLRITERGENGPASVRCRNRCEPSTILAALGLATIGNGNAPAPAEPVTRSITTRALADYEVVAVDWLWRKRIPAGELSVLGGDGGLGKSTFLAHLAKLITHGEITGLNRTGRVLVVLGEDNPARVLRARYEAAGADMTKVEILAADEGAGEEMPVLPDDMPRIREAVERLQPDLLVVDPLSAYLAGSVDAHRDGGRSGLRAVLNPLSQLAHTTGVTVAVVCHYNKGTGPASQRLAGTIALRNAARNVIAFARHPDSRGEDGQDRDDGRRIIGHDKCNVGAEQSSLAAAIREVPVLKADGTPLLDKDGDAATTSVLDVGDLSDVGYEDALAAASLNGRREDDGERDALTEAMEFVRLELEDGPIASRQLDRAATDAGIAKRTLMRARQQLGVKAAKSASGWTVSMPGILGTLGGLTQETPAVTGNPKDANVVAFSVKDAKSAKDAAPCAMAPLERRRPLSALTADILDDEVDGRNRTRATLGLAPRCSCSTPMQVDDEAHCGKCGRDLDGWTPEGGR